MYYAHAWQLGFYPKCKQSVILIGGPFILPTLGFNDLQTCLGLQEHLGNQASRHART